MCGPERPMWLGVEGEAGLGGGGGQAAAGLVGHGGRVDFVLIPVEIRGWTCLYVSSPLLWGQGRAGCTWNLDSGLRLVVAVSERDRVTAVLLERRDPCLPVQQLLSPPVSFLTAVTPLRSFPPHSHRESSLGRVPASGTLPACEPRDAPCTAGAVDRFSSPALPRCRAHWRRATCQDHGAAAPVTASSSRDRGLASCGRLIHWTPVSVVQLHGN